MSDFLSRLKQEKTELEDKTLKLGEFLLSDKIYTLSEGSQLLLQRQHQAMTEYLNVVVIRLELLEK